MVEIKNLSMSFGNKVILEDFCLTLSEGVTALSGPSGCGKTTLLRVLAGLQKPDFGTVEGLSPMNCVILFQENRLLPWRSARQQITDVLPRSRWDETEDWLRLAELDGEGDTCIDQLSGGMQRRLALARALAASSFSPNTWTLLDEPFAGVDTQRAQRILKRIRSLDKPILLSSHEEHILKQCDSVITLSGPPLQIQ